MAFLRNFVSNLGAQNAPFGFGGYPADGGADPAFNSGLQMIGNVGLGMLAQSNSNPLEAFGSSYLNAQQNSQEQNRQQFMAQQMMQDAEYKKQDRQRQQEERDKKNAWLKSISDPKQRAMLEAYPELVDNYIQATDPLFQTQPEQPAAVQEYEYAVQNGYGGSFQDWKTMGSGGSSNVSAQVAERQAAAQSLGLDPADPAYKSYILTGRMPREDQAPLTATDKKAIQEADDGVFANETVIGQLESVITPDATGKSLNDKAGYGWNANAQSWAARNDPTGFFNDEQGQATTDLNNIVLGQALSSLKSIFGAAPTEGERKILVDLQASVDKTPKERESIIKRAIGLAKIRLQYNKQRADALRGQTYYKPGGQPVTTQDGFTIEEVPDGQ